MDRPNLLLFMPDQLRADALGCFGHPLAPTPHIDAVAAAGSRFTQAYAQHPVCSPSRISIMTGLYPHATGHRTLDSLLHASQPNLLRLLKDGGYHVAIAGHRGDLFAPGVTELSTDFCGFLEQPERIFSPCPYPDGHPLRDAYYTGRREADGIVLDFDEAAVRTAEQWLASAPPEPWVLFLPLVFPHPPFEVEDPWYSMYDRAAIPPPVTTAPDTEPGFKQALRDGLGLNRLTPDDWAEIRATYLGMVTRVDHHLGRVLDALDDRGVREETAIVVLSDHGEYAGDQGLVEKWPSGLDDCLVRNPLAISAPGMPGGQEVTALVEMVDLLPTLADLAGVEVAHRHFGRSLLPLLRGETTTHRQAAFSEGGFSSWETDVLEQPAGRYARKGELEHRHPEQVGRATAIRTAEWTYVHRRYEEPELYDRARDPGETRNLAPDPAYDRVVRRLRNQLMDWLQETSDAIPWTGDPRQPEIVHGFRSSHDLAG